MSDQNDRSSIGAGTAIVLALCVLVLLCGGGLLVVVGGTYYLARQQAAAEMRIRAEMMAELGERLLPPGAHAIAIGPDGELFFDDQPTDLAQLKATLDSLVPASERETTAIHIRPGILAPPEVIAQVQELAKGYDQTVDPLPGSSMQIAPEGDEEPAEPKR